MSQIKLESTYYQKSKMFLYPHLGIKGGATAVPAKTFMRWQGLYASEDRKLICRYYMRDDDEFRDFEFKTIKGSPRYDTMYHLSNGFAAYVFDFNTDDIKHDYDAVMLGHYSKTSNDFKRITLDYYNLNKTHVNYIDSYLNPANYYNQYADLLIVPGSHGGDKRYEVYKALLEVEELCSPPDVSKETLREEPVDLSVLKKPLPLPKSNQRTN